MDDLGDLTNQCNEKIRKRQLVLLKIPKINLF